MLSSLTFSDAGSMSLFTSKRCASLARLVAAKGYPHVLTGVVASGFSTVVTAAAGGRRRSRRSLKDSQQEWQQGNAQQQNPQGNSFPVQQDEMAQVQQAGAARNKGDDMIGQNITNFRQQQHSMGQLWQTAAQLGLKGSNTSSPYGTGACDVESSNACDVAERNSSGGKHRSPSRRSRPQNATGSLSSSGTRNRRSGPAAGFFKEGCTEDSSAGLASVQSDMPAAAAHDAMAACSHTSSMHGSNSDAVLAAISRLGRFLDFRERSSKEVLTKLETLGYDRGTAQDVLTALQQAGLQSDARFAEMFVRTYWKGKAQAPWRLAYDLRSRGVAQLHIDAAMAAVFGPTGQVSRREAATEQEAEAWEHLVEVCRQRVELTSSEPQQKRRTKLYSWLQRRGHNSNTIFKIFDAVGI